MHRSSTYVNGPDKSELNPIRCMIVDDERLARVTLRQLLSSFPQTVIVGEAGSGEAALALAEQERPDLLFLDIEMPKMTGFEVARLLKSRPAIVFLTAHEQYAVPAFEEDVLDYLLKPVSADRIAKTIDRYLCMPQPGEAEELKRLIPLGTSGRFVPLANLLMVKASGNYTIATILPRQEEILREKISDWERQLPSRFFLRIDRSTIVNYVAICGIEYRYRTAQIQLGPDFSVTVGARAADRLRAHQRSL